MSSSIFQSISKVRNKQTHIVKIPGSTANVIFLKPVVYVKTNFRDWYSWLFAFDGIFRPYGADLKFVQCKYLKHYTYLCLSPIFPWRVKVSRNPWDLANSRTEQILFWSGCKTWTNQSIIMSTIYYQVINEIPIRDDSISFVFPVSTF